MVRRLCAFGMLLVGMCVERVAMAQEPDHLHGTVVRRVYEGPPLSLAGAIDEALARNPTLVALRQQFEAARLRPAQERFLMPPTFEAQIWQWPIDTVNPLNTNSYMFTMQQEIPGRGKRELRGAVAEKDVELASVEIAVRARDVIKDVTRVYADLAVARLGIDIHLESVGLLRQFADASTITYATGRSPQRDVLKAVVELSTLHEDLVMHDETAATAAARLNTLLDRDPQMPIGPLDEPRDDIALPASEDLQRLAIERQPELRAAQLGLERARASLAAIERDYKPDFFVGGGYMLMPRQAGAWTASGGMTWPNAPWARGRLDGRKAEASADIAAASANIHAVERQIRLAVHEAYVRVNGATQRAALVRTTLLPQSEHTVELSRVGYQTGRADLLTLIDNERALLDARLSYYRALSDRELALADLTRAVGTDIPAVPPTVEVK